MSKIETVRKAMMEALKAGDKPRKEALSLLLSALKAKFIDKRADLTEDEENAVIYKEMKEAQETIDTMPESRQDIIGECKNRISVYGEFAPKRMDESEIKAIIEKAIAEAGLTEPTAKDKGKLMRVLMPMISGKADGSLVNKLVGEYLK
ncbi:MAG: GatB/YqeY domain-containing protein [Eubacteriales bacterium]|nr:GatB/YqeY domain-containing protein [Eubacteriales bacterium]MDD3882924.1 GatB/YqeY domain-containing protein [Eubacteriales bacterium]MDD4513529.1 GatB/YqeY domain-containing protein [Eubacteriales bacterium]